MSSIEPSARRRATTPLLALGFRPFYLLGILTRRVWMAAGVKTNPPRATPIGYGMFASCTTAV
jgi:uncharacterized protein involved in response to NO